MTIAVGQKLPSVTFKQMGPDGPTNLSSDDFCVGQKVILFGLPGAFTPVCSAQHLPGFVEKAGKLKAMGVDAIACVSVNDPFVMAAWGQAHDADGRVDMLADHDGSFTRACGLEIDLSDFGLGERSERYSMLVDDGVIKAINVEDSILAHEVSSAEAILSQI